MIYKHVKKPFYNSNLTCVVKLIDEFLISLDARLPRAEKEHSKIHYFENHTASSTGLIVIYNSVFKLKCYSDLLVFTKALEQFNFLLIKHFIYLTS